jgi:hypothetical protein
MPAAHPQAGRIQVRRPQRALERHPAGSHTHRDVTAVRQPHPGGFSAGSKPPLQRIEQFLLQRLDGLAANVTQQHAADLCWALMDGHLYRSLVAQRGWTTTDFTRWLADSLTATLLRP